jgi:hypothetical protein
MKAYWGCGDISPPFLTSAVGGAEWSATHVCRFTPGGSTPVPSLLEPECAIKPACCQSEENVLLLAGIKLRLLGRPVSIPSLYKFSGPDLR